MYTKADFVKWKLEGPKPWPTNDSGWIYIGVYNKAGYELFVNQENTEVLFKSPSATVGVPLSIETLFRRARRPGDLGLMMRLYRGYQKCLPQPTS